MVNLDSKIASRLLRVSGTLATKLLIIGFLINIIGKIVESKLAVKASHIISLTGLAFGSLWLGGRLLQLSRSGNICYIETYLSIGLWALTPWGLKVQSLQLLGEAAQRIKKYDIQKCDYANEFQAPFKHCWVVVKGGMVKEESHSWGLLSQRYAYDLIRIEDYNKVESPCRYRRLEDWVTYGSPVLAAADGVVVSVYDGAPDNDPVGRIRFTSKTLEGNYVIIKHSPCTYSLYAHLKKGSIIVKEGDMVKQGDVIGEAGNSGMSTAPHLHFQLLSSPSLFSATSLPIKMSYVDIKGRRIRKHPRMGEVICSL